MRIDFHVPFVELDGKTGANALTFFFSPTRFVCFQAFSGEASLLGERVYPSLSEKLSILKLWILL